MISLNLIPPQLKQDFQSSERLHSWLRNLVVVTVLAVLGTVFSGVTVIFMKRHAVSVQHNLQQLQQRQLDSSGKDISVATLKLNKTISTLASTLGTPRSWGQDIATIITGLPSTLTIGNITLQPDGQWQISGTADTRQSFIQLKETLQANTALTKVSTTSTASKRTAIPFIFSGTIMAPSTP